MTRGELGIIYRIIDDKEKKLWAEKAGYASYEGLYRYLKTKAEVEAYSKVSSALIYVIGQTRVSGMIQDIRIKADGLSEADIENYKKSIIKFVLQTNNKDLLLNLKKDIMSACESQLLRMEVETKI